MPLVARHALVSGRVQGVGFRWHARAKAEELGLAGWVRNLPDGRVEILIEGEAEPVRAYLAWLARGPTAARVSDVAVSERACEGSTSFDVVR